MVHTPLEKGPMILRVVTSLVILLFVGLFLRRFLKYKLVCHSPHGKKYWQYNLLMVVNPK